MGKLFLFTAAIESQLYWLVLIGLLASAIGLYYYLRVIVLMYMHKPASDASAAPVPVAAAVAIAIMLVGTFYLGIFPGTFLRIASEAAHF
jgi:NADH-quinone oxidoreductase subunit N